MKSRKVKKFNELVNEGYLNDDEKREDLEHIKDLTALQSAGLVSSDAIRAKKREIIKKAGGGMKTLEDPILGQAITYGIYETLRSPEWKMMQEKGWYIVSTERQLFNGSLLITTKATKNQRAMQITETRYIRRVRINVEWKGDPGVMINGLPGEGPEIYINGLRWINANINPKDGDLESFPKNLRTDPGFIVNRYKGS
jgi:hypothetical protein